MVTQKHESIEQQREYERTCGEQLHSNQQSRKTMLTGDGEEVNWRRR